jgi:PAS domain S-box-containing protein
LPERAKIERAGLIAAVEQAGDGIVITDTAGTIQYVNPAFTAITGYTREEAVGQNTRMLNSGRQPASFYKELWDTIQSGKEWHGDVVNRRKDGAFYDEEMRISPVRGSNRETVSYIAIKRDVTERRAAQETERLLSAITESSDDALMVYTPAGIILTWNSGAENIFGYSAEEAIGKPVSMLVAPERGQTLASFTELVLRGGSVHRHEGVCVRKDGRRIHVTVTGCPVKNRAGKVQTITVSLRDISERKEAEHTRALLASIVESSDDAIIGYRLDGTIASWNRGAEALFGYSPQHIVGTNASILRMPERIYELENTLEAIKKGLSVGPFETICIHKDGGQVDVSICVSPIRDGAGEVSGSAAIIRDIGQRLQAERKRRVVETLFRNVFEHAPFGICVNTIEGRFLQVNATLSAILGYRREELLSLEWPQLTHPDDREDSRRALGSLQDDLSSSVELEKRYIHRSGNIVCSRTQVSLVRDSSGAPLYFVVHVEDITERKRAEAALRETQERFRIMADGCPALMWVTDAKGGSEFINRAYREFCGKSSEELAGVKWHLALHPEDAPKYLEACERAVREHTPFRGEVRVRRFDGEWRWFASHAEPRFSADGEFLGHVGLSPDITERKKDEQALRSSEEKFRQLAENLREVFWMMSPAADEILYISPAYEQVWGRTCKSLYENPMSWTESIHPDDVERAHEVFGRQLQGEIVKSEYRILTATGEKWICDRAFPIRDEAGQLIRIVGIADEITEQKRYEAELILAREGAEVANEAKSRFLANMSHEIRTPMNGVIGMIQLLLETDLNAEQRRYATVAKSSGRTLLALIDDILDLSKIEARKITLEKLSFDPRAVIEDVAQLLRVQSDDKGLRLEARVSPEVPAFLVGDAHRLRQVLTNLCANAIKFTERGEVRINAELASREEGAATVRFTIADTGIGIGPDRVSEIFSPFVQADVSTTRKYGGTGLGLAISKQLVAMMGGSIGVDSVEGSGSTFWFNAVFELASGEELLASQPAATPKHGRLLRGGRAARILVAEDNMVNREVALALLRKLGYKGVAVKNGVEAIEAVEHESYDLVLMDCEMPVMDGFEATRHMRDSIHTGVPIIALTANAMAEDRDRCLREGMNDYLAKPVDLVRLAEVLDRWLQVARSETDELLTR